MNNILKYIIIGTLFLGLGLGGGYQIGKYAIDFNTSKNIHKKEVSFEKKPSISNISVEGYASIVESPRKAVVNVFSEKIVRNISPWDFFFRDFSDNDEFQFPQIPQRTRRERSLGSGVIISENGYILTNNHVINGADKIFIALSSDEEQDNKQNSNNEIEAKLIGADSQTDLALLKIEKNDLPFIPFADSDNARIGDIVFAIGNPFGIGQTVTMGIISAKRKENLGVTPYDYFIQTDAAINPGNSGGALIDSEGNLIGISTALFSKSGGYQGIGLAVPSNTAQRIADSLKQNGKVKRPYLGISVIDLNEDINPITIEFLNKGYKEGALVLKVQPGGKAYSVGVKPGTLVNNINGKQVKSSEELIRFALKLKEGEEVKLKADVLDLQKGNITKKEFSFIPEVK